MVMMVVADDLADLGREGHAVKAGERSGENRYR
jgi:hypothetical protein